MRFSFRQGRLSPVLEIAAVSSPRKAIEEAAGVIELRGNVDRVDTAKQVIRGVKIIGLESRNTGRVLGLSEKEFGAAVDKPYAYTMDCLRRAASMYEGTSVYSNHIDFGYTDEGHRFVKGDGRKNDDMVGWLTNVRVVEGKGLYGDLNYLASSRMSPLLVEIAQRRPDRLALSHEAQFDSPKLGKDGRIYLTEIVAVDAVALVNGTPGTTNGLFEQHTYTPSPEGSAMRRSLRQILESSPKSTEGRQILIEMLGGDEESLGMEADAIEVDFGDEGQKVSPAEQIRAGLLATVSSAMDKATAQQLRAVLKALGQSDSLSETVSGMLGADDAVVEAPVEEMPAETEAEAEPVAEPAAAEPAAEPVAAVPEEEEPVAEAAFPGAAPPFAADGQEEETEEDGEVPSEEVEEEPVVAVAETSVGVQDGAVVLECIEILNQSGAGVDRDILEAMALLPRERWHGYAAKIGQMQAVEAIVQYPEPRSQSPVVAAARSHVAEDVAKKYAVRGTMAQKFRQG